MTRRRQGAMGERERRTQEAFVAALRARPRTSYRAGQCVLVAEASLFSSLLGPHQHTGTAPLRTTSSVTEPHQYVPHLAVAVSGHDDKIGADLPRHRDYGRRRLTGGHSSLRGHSVGGQPGHLPVEIRLGLLFDEGGLVPGVAVDHAQQGTTCRPTAGQSGRCGRPPLRRSRLP